MAELPEIVKLSGQMDGVSAEQSVTRPNGTSRRRSSARVGTAHVR